MWLMLGLISAVFLGLYDVCKKASLKDNAVLPVLFLATVSTALPFAVLTILSQWLGPDILGRAYVAQVSWRVHGLLMMKSLIVSSSWVCAYFAYKHLPITLGAPIRAAQPVLTLMGAMIIFSERFSLLSWCGIMMAVGSYFALSITGQKEGVRFVRNGWVGLLLLGTLLGQSVLYTISICFAIMRPWWYRLTSVSIWWLYWVWFLSFAGGPSGGSIRLFNGVGPFLP